MQENEVQRHFGNILSKNEDMSAGIAAMETLMEIIRKSTTGTVQGLKDDLTKAREAMCSTECPVAAIKSGSELFLRFITLAQLDTQEYDKCKKIMLDRGENFLKKLRGARGKIARRASQFIINGSNVLTHSRSRVVLSTFVEAAKENKNFHVYVTQSSSDNSGDRMCSDLKRERISHTLILDSAVGYIMEKIDFVMVGAEAVVESGGIVNKIGSYTISLCAKEKKKPFYVLTESFKFVRLFPLSPTDLPDEYKYTSKMRKEDLSTLHPLVDYTPPSYITLMFTDLGVLTPSAVSDELINLYL